MPSKASPDFFVAQVMGILNVTPDSFSDGGLHLPFDSALKHAERMVDEGAAIIDVGGESTRPGAREVSEAEELDRVIPVIEGICRRIPVLVSVDTCKPAVMREAVAHGAGMINDVFALRKEGALETAARLGVPVCLMHMQGTPRDMQHAPSYGDVVAEVKAFLVERIAAAVDSGIPWERIIIDPGFGFGKNVQHNLSLIRELRQFVDLGCPVLVGLSRKSMLGAILGRELDQRVHGSVAAATLAAWAGARIIRAHDVAATVDALRFVQAVRGDGQ